jgi:hypothetical protein
MVVLFVNAFSITLLFLWFIPLRTTGQVLHRDTVIFLRAQHPDDPSKKRELLEFHTTDTTYTWLKGIPSRSWSDKVISGHYIVSDGCVELYAADNSVHRRFRIRSHFIGAVPDQLMYEDILRYGLFRRLVAVRTRYESLW